MTQLKVNIYDHDPVILKAENKQNNININAQGFLDIVSQTPAVNIVQTKYLEIIKTNELEIEGVEFKFTDYLWDFSSIRPEHAKIHETKSYKYDFVGVNTDIYKTLLRFYTLNLLITFGIHRTFTKKEFTIVKKLLIHLEENKIFQIDYLSYGFLSSYIEKIPAVSTRNETKKTLNNFLTFYSSITECKFDGNIFKFLKAKDPEYKNKLQLLPYEFMNKLTQLLNSNVFNEALSVKERSICGILYIGTQTGLRNGELCMLERGCIEQITINSIDAAILHYKSTKSIKGSGYEMCKTIANRNVVQVVKVLESISCTEKLCNGITIVSLKKHFDKLVVKNAQFLGCISNNPDPHFNGIPVKIENGYINIPLIKQFRVYFQTEMRRRGFSAMAVSKLLNHHDEKMMDYYGRAVSDFPEEEKEFTKRILRDILNDDVEVLGANTDKVTKRLEKFTENKIVKTAIDLEEIIDEIIKEVPIRQLNGGACIKPNSTRTCEFETNSDEIVCAFEHCPNQYHFYFNLKYYHDKMRDIVRSYKHNKKHGYKLQSEKELHKIHNIISSKLSDEIKSLEKMIESKGKEYVVETYEYLSEIIENIEEIKKDIEKWKSKKS